MLELDNCSPVQTAFTDMFTIHGYCCDVLEMLASCAEA